ncbi:MAG: tRNA (N6-threonylcarbamoyladenosine(37)-N6)-methyltransferase TrmO [Candidatus Omnitrophota bacterium]
MMKYIGIIHSPFKSLKGMPIQPLGGMDVEGTAIVDKKYAKGLKDLDGFSHVYLIYRFHKAPCTKLIVEPFMDVKRHGVFATRSPVRPTHIGLSIVELVRIKGNRLTFRGCDMLDGTPLLDIKPYIPAFDDVKGATSGWMKASRHKIRKARTDCRFV